jgi:hypothetical protein
MRQMIFSLMFLMLAALAGFAQGPDYTFYPRTDNFTFDKTRTIVSWNGSDPSNPPYPHEMGAVGLDNNGIGSIDIPWQLGAVTSDNGVTTSGYLNNGYLAPCNFSAWGPKSWVIGDGTHAGDTFMVTASTLCPYFTGEYGSAGNSYNISDGFSATATYVRTFKKSCNRGRCTTFPVDTLTGGTGTTQQIKIDPNGP